MQISSFNEVMRMHILRNLSEFASAGRTALSDETGSMSFAQLDARSDAIAVWLADNIPVREPVAVWGDKEHDMACCIFGALKSNHPYVIIPSHYPYSRVEEICKDCDPAVLFHIGQIPMTYNFAVKLYSSDIDSWVRKYRGCHISTDRCVQPDDISCIFYTSGSTGVPKGVQISRANIEAYLDWWGSIVSPWLSDCGGRALNFASYAFCASMGNLFYVMADRGMTLHAVSRALAMDYSGLFDCIHKADPHYEAGTPSFFKVCLQDSCFRREYLPNLKFIAVSGEAMPPDIARQLLERFPDVYLCNKFGTTETTLGNISCRVTCDMIDNSMNPVPIGKESTESQVLIVDEDHNRLPDGQTGELTIISGMVSRGYLHDPERSGQVFFTAQDGRHGYYTGDLAYRKNNLLYYAGRRDNLVKVGGYRVELEDVERNILLIDIIRDCAVVPVTHNSQVSILAAYIVLKEPAAKTLPAIISIKKELGKLVPAYMIPQKIVITDMLPRNTSNKIDRAALMEKERLSSAY